MRRSSRNGALRESAASALADLAARKASGTTRTADYKVHEEDDIYETVDEETYAAIAARKRKEARDFIDAGDGVDGHVDDDAAAMELEFAMEDQLSVVNPGRDRKRQRTSAPRARQKKVVPPTKRVASAFFNSFHAASAGTATEEVEDGTKGVLDVGLLDADFDKHISASRAARKKRKQAVQRSVGDMLFDTPQVEEEPAGLMNVVPPVAAAPEPQDEYAAPPPSANAKTSVPVEVAAANPVLEDSLDPDALLAAVDDAINKRTMGATTSKPPLRLPKPDPMPAPAPPQRFHTPQSFASNVPANAPIARDHNGDVIMFWTDAHDVRVNGGQHLYLFGKVPVQHINSGLYASVCVRVDSFDRVLYVLPRKTRVNAKGVPTADPVDIMKDVYPEITSLLLGSQSSRPGMRAASNLPTALKAKKVLRSCPFGDPIAPRTATEYLKVKFPFANMNRVTPETTGTSFSKVFGTKTSASEALCLKTKLKGPGWVRLTNSKPMERSQTHAKHALCVPDVNDISIATDLASRDPPPLSSLCVSVKTMLNAKNGAHEIVMVSGVYVREIPLNGPLRDGALEPGGQHGTRDFVILRPPDGQSVPFGFSDRARSVLARGGAIEMMPNEPALLNNFLAKLLNIDPDVLIGHDVLGFGLDALIARMSVRRSREWSRLGRLVQRRDLTQVVKNQSSSMWFKAEAVAGRLVLDTYAHAKDLLMREKDYSLSALSHNVLAPSALKGHHVTIAPSTDVSLVPKAFESTDSLCRLVSECSHEARTAGRLAAHLSILPLTRQLTCISGNLWSHTMRGARAERIESLLCHEFKLVGSSHAGASAKAGDVEVKLILPDKLNKFERAKMAELVEAEQTAADNNKTDADPKKEDEEAGVAEYGYGVEADTKRTGPAIQNGSSISKSKNAKSNSNRRKPQYSGGLVLEPKKGFYDRYILQLDFNSLYPSIIQEYNICFTTLRLREGDEKPNPTDGEMDDRTAAVDSGSGLPLPNKSLLEGVLPRVLRRLVEQRRQVKRLLKEERQKHGETLRAQQLDIRQLAIKLTANSLYGCLGFEGSRYFARPLAEMVTCQGRDTLQKTVDVARDVFNAQVIYGDTDSLFVYTGLDDISRVRSLGAELKRDVNKKYKTLEIEIDAIYKKMLLLKKKKYAALKVIDPTNPDKVVREVKGLDLVRHDWCDLSHDASEHFLSQIFDGQSSNMDDAVGNVMSFLKDLAAQVRGNQVALSKYVITRGLTKRPQDYPDGVSLPHVTVAMRMIKEQQRRIQPGDYIKYTICVPRDTSKEKPTPSGNLVTRAYHPDEVIASKGKLTIDVNYYLESQVLPPIMRLCEPIECIEASRIAESLGLDGRRYERREYEEGNNLALGPQSTSEKFRDVDPLLVTCKKCGTKTELCGAVFAPSGKALKSSGLECVQCRERFEKAALMNCVSLTLRGWLRKYYTTPLRLNGDDGRRARETRDVGLGGNASLSRRVFDEAWLYKQLRYAHFLMDVESRWREVCKDEDKRAPVGTIDASVYSSLLGCVDRVFDANAYRFVDMSQFLVHLGLG